MTRTDTEQRAYAELLKQLVPLNEAGPTAARLERADDGTWTAQSRTTTPEGYIERQVRAEQANDGTWQLTIVWASRDAGGLRDGRDTLTIQ